MRAFLRKLYNIWISERPSQLAASLAYYGMFSFAPVIYIGYLVAGLFIDQLKATERMYQRMEALLGPETAGFIQDAVSAIGQADRSGTLLGSLDSFIALLAAASGLFFQLQYALNKIWRVPPPERGQTGAFIRQRLFSFIMVLGVGLLLILATLTNLIVGWLGSWLEVLFEVSVPSLILTGLGSLALLTLAFALLYKVLPDVEIDWRDVWAGAFAVLLIGIYYVAQIFLFGAVFCRIYAGQFGSHRPVK